MERRLREFWKRLRAAGKLLAANYYVSITAESPQDIEFTYNVAHQDFWDIVNKIDPKWEQQEKDAEIMKQVNQILSSRWQSKQNGSGIS